MKHGSLFSGIGGFDFAAEWMGWQNVFHCEWNPFCQKVLKYYWPQAESLTDITKTDFTKYHGTIDIISGGFPCQPYSSAGKRLGKADERHLWPEMLRAIREIEPTYIVGENVRGLLNWNGGMVFDEVCAELENLGYQVAPCLIPACGVGAPHKRERIWFVAYADKQRNTPRGTCTIIKKDRSKNNDESKKWIKKTERINGFYGFQWDVADACNKGLQGDEFNESFDEKQREQSITHITASKFHKINNWHSFPTVSPICNGDDGLSNRLDNITFPKWRNESIKAGGNAIVSQVALQIFKAIQQYENEI